ncbi:hypothetical protein RQP46_002643 [Phenoliferia psychrophenolica]
MDNLMNLQLLTYVASRTGNATYLSMATSHANKTLANNIRSDLSSFHLVDYSPTTGAVQRRGTAQGYSDSSYAMMYNNTGIVAYLNTARAMAQWFLNHLPASGVPYWDFNAPLPTTLDTSAATITASGLLLLSTFEMKLSNITGANYWNTAAAKLLSNTAVQGIRSWSGASLLGNGTVNNAQKS